MLTQRSQLEIRVIALLTAVVGIVNLLSAVTPWLSERVELIRDLFPFPLRAGAHLFSVLAGFFLLTLANSLLRRKRAAWWLAVALLAGSVVSHLVKGLNYEESTFAGVILVPLILMRDRFTAQSDRPSLTHGVQRLIVALLFTLLYGTLGFYILDREFKQQFNLWQALQQTLAMFFTADNAGLAPTNRFG
jgi:phosphatidylglycerol lysyltransferase